MRVGRCEHERQSRPQAAVCGHGHVIAGIGCGMGRGGTEVGGVYLVDGDCVHDCRALFYVLADAGVGRQAGVGESRVCRGGVGGDMGCDSRFADEALFF